jgi:Lsr2
MPTSGPSSGHQSRESKYPQSEFGESSLQSLRQPRQDGHEMVVGMMDETDGSQADETVHFGLDGAEFELNLSKAHAEELRHVLEPYIKAGRKTGSKMNGRAANDKDQAWRSWSGPSNTA